VQAGNMHQMKYAAFRPERRVGGTGHPPRGLRLKDGLARRASREGTPSLLVAEQH
jgi:hypothetical protein